ncbi:hypothetical protein R3I94_008779 [Phoxinus phoxinus]
MALKDSQ